MNIVDKSDIQSECTDASVLISVYTAEALWVVQQFLNIPSSPFYFFGTELTERLKQMKES